MYSCDGKAEISAVIIPVFNVTWSSWNYSFEQWKMVLKIDNSIKNPNPIKS